MELFDWIIVAGYFLIIFSIAILASRSKQAGSGTSAGYFLAGRHAGWYVIGASLFAANIGSEHLVGLAGTGASSGVAVAQFEIAASWILLLLGWVFVPFYLSNGVFTMPEFLERRYSPAARWYLALISIIGYVLTKISVTIAAGGIVFEAIMGIDFWTGALVVVIFTGLYTILGGLRAILLTDGLQIIIIIVGSSAVTFFGLKELGGFTEMRDIAGSEFLNMWKPMSDPAFPWTGILFGVPILGVWYWCTDQFIVQRVLSARDINHARGGTIFAGFLKMLPLFIFVIPGVIAYCLAKSGQLELDKPDQALPALIINLLPIGLRGLVVAGLLAALTSSLASVFNSCSSLMTMDIYRKIHPTASEKTLVKVGKITTVILVILGLAWIPLMKLISEQLYQYLQSVQAYIAPPITAVFVFGILSRRVNAKGAMFSLITGFVLGMARLILELNEGHLSVGWLLYIVEMNFLHFAIFLFLICSAVLFLVSFLTSAPQKQVTEGMTFQGGFAVLSTKTKGNVMTIFGSLLLILLILSIWWYFSG